MFSKKGERSNRCLKTKKLEELCLNNAKLRFCPDQLQNLNFMFNKRLQQKLENSSDKAHLLAKSVTERLVQRLLCAAGMIDQRFASKFLICNNQQGQNPNRTNLEYMVRLDNLSTPALYDTDSDSKFSIIENDPDYPPAYARIRMDTSESQIWSEYTNSSGYLRRDKVQARMVELLAMAATQDTPNSPLQVDESRYCGIPGKIVDAFTLYHILNIPSNQHVFYGPSGNVPRFPDPRDFRLAIIDDPDGIKLKVEFLSPALSTISISVCILLVIGVPSWPLSTDFPFRTPMGHSDCLLFYQAAQTGMYLVGYGVQSSAWQIRMPAAEYVLINHYSINSTVTTVLDVLYNILEDIDNARCIRRKQVSYKILSNYVLLTVLLEELEENSKSPFVDMLNWSPMYLSTQVLKLLDKLMPKLLSENQPNYFFKKSNLLVNPGHWSDDDFSAEMNNIKAYMVRLFDESLMSTKGNQDFDKMMISQESEMVLLYKWKELVDGLIPPQGTRGRRFCFAGSQIRQAVAHTQYTNRQLEYINLLLKSMLITRQNILQPDHTMLEKVVENTVFDKEGPVEDIIYILVTIMDQARNSYLKTQTNPNILKNKAKIKLNYNIYTAKVVDLMRKDKEVLNINFGDDLDLVKIILKWLYRAMDQNKKYLAPILRPYLHTIFTTSHSISCHLDSIKNKLNDDELSALGSFAQLVNSGVITPAQGLIDSVNKNWLWAKKILEMVEDNSLRLVFVEGEGKVYRHILSLPSYSNNDMLKTSKSLESIRGRTENRRQKTLPVRSYFNSVVNMKINESYECIIPQHQHLKNSSPMTLILSSKHRKGDHRGCGDILKALSTMNKLNMFQEAACRLPEQDRKELVEVIQSLQPSKFKKSLNKKWSNTLPHVNKNKLFLSNESVQKYTPKEESAGIMHSEVNMAFLKMKKADTNSLLGTCRAARLREDSSIFLLEDSFRIKSLLNKSDKFKS